MKGSDLMRIVFMGTPDFATTILERLLHSDHDIVLVVSQPDRPIGRKRVMTPPPVKTLAISHQIPVFQPERIRDGYQPIIDAKADLLITAAYGQMLPASLLRAIKAINVHGSLLPAYRGGAPIQYALFDGCEKTGVSIMTMKMKMDSGDIICQRETKITGLDDYGTLSARLAQIGADLLMTVLETYEQGTVQTFPQDERMVTYARTLTYEDEAIDFKASSRDIVNRLRGLSPLPGGHAMINGITVKMFKATETETVENALPGTVLSTTKRLIVKTGDHAVDIESIQIPGKKKMNVRDFLNGQSLIKCGDLFT